MTRTTKPSATQSRATRVTATLVDRRGRSRRPRRPRSRPRRSCSSAARSARWSAAARPSAGPGAARHGEGLGEREPERAGGLGLALGTVLMPPRRSRTRTPPCRAERQDGEDEERQVEEERVNPRAKKNSTSVSGVLRTGSRRPCRCAQRGHGADPHAPRGRRPGSATRSPRTRTARGCRRSGSRNSPRLSEQDVHAVHPSSVGARECPRAGDPAPATGGATVALDRRGLQRGVPDGPASRRRAASRCRRHGGLEQVVDLVAQGGVVLGMPMPYGS